MTRKLPSREQCRRHITQESMDKYYKNSNIIKSIWIIRSLQHFLSCCSALSARAVKGICKEQVLSWSQDQKIVCSHCQMYLPKDLPEQPIQALRCCSSFVKAPDPGIICLCESLWLCIQKKYQKCDIPKNLTTRKQVKNVSTKPVHTAFVCSWDAWGLQHL